MKTSIINQGSTFTAPAGLYEFANPPGNWAAKVKFQDIPWTKPPQCPPNAIPIPAAVDLKLLGPESDTLPMTIQNTDMSYFIWAANEWIALNAGLQWADAAEQFVQFLSPVGLTRAQFENRIAASYQSNMSASQAFLPSEQLGALRARFGDLRLAFNFIRTSFDSGQNPSMMEIIQNLANPFWVMENVSPFNPQTGQHNPQWLQTLAATIKGPGLNNPADVTRFSLFAVSLMTNLSAAYGLGVTHIVFTDNKRPGFFQRLWSGIKRYFPVMVAGRNAALALIQLNFRDSAAKMHSSGGDKLYLTWERLGGTKSALISAIQSGRTKTPLLGDPATAALIAAGASIIIALIQSLNEGEEPLDAFLSGFGSIIGQSAQAYCQVYQEQLQAMIGSVAADASDDEYLAMLAPFINLPGFATCDNLQDALASLLPDKVANAIFPPATGGNSGAPGTAGPVPYVPPSNGAMQKNNTALLILGGMAILAATNK